MASPIISRTEGRDSALSAHMSQVFNYMAGGVGVSGLVAYLAATNPAVMQIAVKGQIVWLFAILGAAFFLQSLVFRLQPAAGLAVFAGFSALMGFALSPLALVYTGSSIATAFFTASVMFAGTAAYGYFTKKSLSSWGTFLIMGVWGLVGASLIGLVLSLFGINMGPMAMVLNIIAIPLFAGLTAWEVNSIRENFAAYGRDELLRSRLAITQAISLYINFINMFTSLLHLMGDRR
ncbi:MAG: Bax inhibitor-1/YccA family protein [Blastochloris viridis]|uniref:Bax inhibitor-1/YccA family protein n=1 Tax=Blastochloris viridis TaxID=1079 RepID=A0A6N4RCP8_BLAVI|nr:MAG: Bax inhibitor-1/YccA family protein [Blastochloris viridis]